MFLPAILIPACASSSQHSVFLHNVSGLNTLVKRQSGRLDLKKKKNLQYTAYRRLTSGQKTQRVKNVKERKKIFHANWKQQESGDSNKRRTPYSNKSI